MSNVIIKCPSCGEDWNITKHNACECGATKVPSPAAPEPERAEAFTREEVKLILSQRESYFMNHSTDDTFLSTGQWLDKNYIPGLHLLPSPSSTPTALGTEGEELPCICSQVGTHPGCSPGCTFPKCGPQPTTSGEETEVPGLDYNPHFEDDIYDAVREAADDEFKRSGLFHAMKKKLESSSFDESNLRACLAAEKKLVAYWKGKAEGLETSKEGKTSFKIIVNGQPTVIEASENDTMLSIMERALVQTQNTARPVSDWTMRTHGGEALSKNDTVEDLDEKDGNVLFLSLNAGIGAADIARTDEEPSADILEWISKNASDGVTLVKYDPLKSNTVYFTEMKNWRAGAVSMWRKMQGEITDIRSYRDRYLKLCEETAQACPAGMHSVAEYAWMDGYEKAAANRDEQIAGWRENVIGKLDKIGIMDARIAEQSKEIASLKAERDNYRNLLLAALDDVETGVEISNRIRILISKYPQTK